MAQLTNLCDDHYLKPMWLRRPLPTLSDHVVNDSRSRMAKEKPASEKVVTNIASLAKGFIRSETNANNFIDILEFLEVDL